MNRNLDRLAKENVSQQDFRNKMDGATVNEMKELVKDKAKERLTAKKQLTRHLDLCSDIYEKKKAADFKIQLGIERDILQTENFDDVVSYIHTMICRQEPDKYRPLQLLCLLSTVNNGLPQECYEMLCRSYLQVYGYENIPLLYKLEQLNLFRPKKAADPMISAGNSTPLASRGEGIRKMGKNLAQNFTDKVPIQKTFYQFMRKRLNLTPEFNQQTKSTPGPDIVRRFSIFSSSLFIDFLFFLFF